MLMWYAQLAELNPDSKTSLTRVPHPKQSANYGPRLLAVEAE